MATFSVAARNAAIDALVALLETGTTNPGIRFSIRTSGSSLQTTFMPTPAFPAASSGQASLLAPLEITITTANTADEWILVNRGITIVVSSSSIGGPGSGAEIEMTPSTTVAVGQRYILNLTIAMA